MNERAAFVPSAAARAALLHSLSVRLHLDAHPSVWTRIEHSTLATSRRRRVNLPQRMIRLLDRDRRDLLFSFVGITS